jgi:hypothetical protein
LFPDRSFGSFGFNSYYMRVMEAKANIGGRISVFERVIGGPIR